MQHNIGPRLRSPLPALRLTVVMVYLLLPGGCRRQAERVPPAGQPEQQPAPPPTALPAPPAVFDPVDPAADDSATPSWLPHPREIPGWVRTTNVRVLDRQDWSALGGDRLNDCADAYLIESALICEYTSVTPAPGGAVAAVTLVKAEHADDAFGLLTAMVPPGPRDRFVGSVSCLQQEGDLQIVHGWEGPYYLHVLLSPGSAPAPEIAVEKLAAGLLRPVPSEPLPELLNHFPTAGRIPGRTWVIRKRLQVLPEDIRREVLRGSAAETTQALGLGPQTLMAVVVYDPGSGEPPNVVWAVRYPAVEQAGAAAGRYKDLLRRIKPAPKVMLDLPQAPGTTDPAGYLCGTWTADQDSIMHVLSALSENLKRVKSTE